MLQVRRVALPGNPTCTFVPCLMYNRHVHSVAECRTRAPASCQRSQVQTFRMSRFLYDINTRLKGAKIKIGIKLSLKPTPELLLQMPPLSPCRSTEEFLRSKFWLRDDPHSTSSKHFSRPRHPKLSVNLPFQLRPQACPRHTVACIISREESRSSIAFFLPLSALQRECRHRTLSAHR
jgi:hypothetical protein